VVYQQMRRWIDARCFETMVEDLRKLLREYAGRKPQPSAMILDSRTLQSTPESGARAGYDGAKRRKGSKVHAAVDINGNDVSWSSDSKHILQPAPRQSDIRTQRLRPAYLPGS
jgi:hypothetical protein